MCRSEEEREHALHLCKGLAAYTEEYPNILENRVSELFVITIILLISFYESGLYEDVHPYLYSQYGSERGVCRAESKGQQILCEP